MNRILRSPSRLLVALVAASVILVSCSSGDGTASNQLVINKYAGDAQSVIASLPVPIAPTVRVTIDGAPVAGDTVTFAIADPVDGPGGGMLTGAVKVTGADGLASVGSWVPGVAGGHTLSANIIGADAAPARFAATAIPYQLLVTAASGTNGQSAHVGTAVPNAPAVKVELVVAGKGLTPLAGATVTFTVGDGGGIVSGGVVITDTNGMASVGSWRLGSTPGPNTLTVTVSPLPDVLLTFVATGTP